MSELAMMGDKSEFEIRYTQKGKDVLDNIFGEFSPDRERVRLSCPRREHEVVMVVDYNSPEQFTRVLGSLCKWLEDGTSFESLENLMLY